MPLVLEEATYGDMSRLVYVLFEANNHPIEPFFDLYYPGLDPKTPPGREKALERCTSEWLEQWKKDSRQHWIKVVDTETGEIIAASKWTVYESDPSKEWEATPPAAWLPEGSKIRQYAEFTLRVRFDRYLERTPVPHVLLNVFATLPEHRRRGAGTLMVGWGARRADELGVDAVVEASVLGEPLYEKAGFLPVGAALIPRIDTDDLEMIAIQDKWPFRSRYMWRPRRDSGWTPGAPWPWEEKGE